MRIFISLLISFYIYAESPLSISFGPVNVGEKRIEIDLSNFHLEKENKSNTISAKMISGSTQWIRTQENLLAPRALVEIKVNSQKTISISHHEKVILASGDKIKTTRLYINIFDPQEIKIFENNKHLDSLRLESNIKLKNKVGHLVDYSCAPYNVDVQGLDDQYLSIGCSMERHGSIGREKARLTITWATTNFYVNKKMRSPYTVILNEASPLNIFVQNSKGEKRKIKITANFNNRAHRLKAAFGLGPYMFKTNLQEEQRDPAIAPAAMLYAKWELTEVSSFRAFDALVAQTSLFNNAGLYFAYDVASAFDNRVKFVPLLGLQLLTFKYDLDRSDYNRIIYPQGLEIVWKHAFGVENYHVIYGMFLSPETEVDYSNFWIRWGKRYFWELNYISFASEERKAHMWGLSLGLPLGQFF